jgi:hypothetical protein
MKKLYFAAALILGSLALKAQTFSVSANDLYINTTTTQTGYAQTVFTNLTTSTVDFRYDLITETLDPSWSMQFCDPNSCFVSPRQTDDFQLGREGSAIFKLDIDPNNVPGSAIYQLKVYPINTPSEVDTLTWYINSTVGVQEAAFAKEIQIFPNPAQDRLHMSSSNGVLLKGQVELYDLSGRQVASCEVKQVYELEVNVANLNPGIYTLRYSTNQGNVYKKFVKAN